MRCVIQAATLTIAALLVGIALGAGAVSGTQNTRVRLADLDAGLTALVQNRTSSTAAVSVQVPDLVVMHKDIRLDLSLTTLDADRILVRMVDPEPAAADTSRMAHEWMATPDSNGWRFRPIGRYAWFGSDPNQRPIPQVPLARPDDYIAALHRIFAAEGITDMAPHPLIILDPVAYPQRMPGADIARIAAAAAPSPGALTAPDPDADAWTSGLQLTVRRYPGFGLWAEIGWGHPMAGPVHSWWLDDDGTDHRLSTGIR
jgi:hypothetical protein